MSAIRSLTVVDRTWRGEANSAEIDPLTDVEALPRRFDLPQDRCFGNGVSFCFKHGQRIAP